MTHELLVGIVVSTALCATAFTQPKALRFAHGASMQASQSSSAEAELREVEQRVEIAITNGDVTSLQSVFADDFLFVHFHGDVTDKAASLQQVAKRPYISRHLDGLKIEMHGDVAVTNGLLDISARGEHGASSYLVKYLRVYERRNGHWQMSMQRGLEETAHIAFEVPSPK
jgi:ketosteroid isomerase-like protein